jgi:hypothetical protein
MYVALLERSLNELKAVRQHIEFSASLRTQVGQHSAVCKAEGVQCFDIGQLLSAAPEPTKWKTIDHSAALTRAYALFESFVADLLAEYLSFLSQSYRIHELGVAFVNNYTKGIGRILADRNKSRYENINVLTLIKEATAALSDKDAYQIQLETMLHAEQNLRMTELNRIFSNCGLKGVEAWISSHAAMISFFQASSGFSGTASSSLTEVIKYRNEAAHGKVDQLLGANQLIDVTKFFECLFQSIVDFVRYDTLTRARALGRATVLGTIIHRHRDDIVIAKMKNVDIKIREKIYVQGSGLILLGEINSIQINDADHEHIAIHNEREVGLKIGVRAKTGCQIIRYPYE